MDEYKPRIKMGRIVSSENTLEKPHKHVFYPRLLLLDVEKNVKTCAHILAHSFTIETNVFMCDSTVIAAFFIFFFWFHSSQFFF